MSDLPSLFLASSRHVELRRGLPSKPFSCVRARRHYVCQRVPGGVPGGQGHEPQALPWSDLPLQEGLSGWGQQ
jgi:hypothetical protein